MLETFSEFDTSFYIFGFKTLQTRKSEAAKAGWQIISLPYGTSSELWPWLYVQLDISIIRHHDDVETHERSL